MLAVVGSKLDGTGLEKLQMVQTQVAALAGSGGGRYGLSDRAGDPVPGLPGDDIADALVCSDERFSGLGIRVIFAEDLRNPA